MFFESNQVNSFLNCKKCGDRLDEPRILLCGNSICSLCALSIQIKDREFQCLICKEKHKMPKNGLPINNVVAEILSCKPVNVSHGKAFSSLKETLNKLLSLLLLIY